jgi:hypothetical protein
VPSSMASPILGMMTVGIETIPFVPLQRRAIHVSF